MTNWHFIHLIWCSCFRRRLQQDPNASCLKQDLNAPICQVPKEIIHELVKVLSPSDAVAFSLTSKWILRIVGKKLWEVLDEDYLPAFLEQLQRDMPNHLLCHQCITFHHKGAFKYHEYPRNQRCVRKNGKVPGLIEVNNLPFTYAQQVMNRHLYGSKHTVSLDAAHFVDNERYDGLSRQMDYELRVAGNEIIFKQGASISFAWDDWKWDDWKPSQEVPFNYSFHLCPHSKSAKYKKESLVEGVLTKCSICQGESEFNLRRTRKHTYTYWVRTWHLLGPCRDPFEPQWQLMARQYRHEKAQRTITSKGAVLRNRFNAALE